MVKGKAIVRSEIGIHARPAAKIATCTKKSSSEVTFRYDDKTVDPGNYIKLMSLAIKYGTEIEIIVDGSDENEVLSELIEILETM